MGKKNNVICILIDSVIADYFGTKRCRISPTPYMDMLRSESLVANNMYSHGPYTDAATKSLYTGRNCLDDYAFYYRLENAPSNHYKVFHENGYETYGIYYPYYIVGKNVKQHIDHTYYTSGFIFSSEWNEIFKYYSELYKNGRLNDTDWQLLIKRTELMFEAWALYYEEVLSIPQSADLMRNVYRNFDIQKVRLALNNEQLEFCQDKRKYIKGLLMNGLQHPLASLDNLDISAVVDKEALSRFYETNKSIFNKFSKLNKRANLVSNIPSLKRILFGLKESIKHNSLEDVKFLANYWCLINDIDFYKKKSVSNHWKNLPSAGEQLDFAFNVLKERQNIEKPFYLSLHFLDTHSAVSFFSYDNLEKAKVELNMLGDYVDELGHEFTGALSYILAIRYVDYCIESFCEKLKKQGLWENTTIMFFADHGSSYSFTPLHGPRTNTFDDENYHVPFMIRTPGFTGEEVDDYYNSKDMFPTLFEMVGIKKPDSFIGHSLLDKSYIPPHYVMTEYPGPGCPDVKNKKLWFSIRDDKYIVGYKVGIYEPFENGEIVVFDLSNDPYGYYNVFNKLGKEPINYLLVHIEERYKQVKKETEVFLRNMV